MEFQELLSRFAVALGIGLLMGLERGWKTREDAPGTRTAGIRTFAIVGLLGGAVGAIAQAAGPANAAGGIVLGLGFAAFATSITIFCRDENLAEKNFSATTAIAAMTAFALGAYALIGDFRVAAAAAVAVTVILAAREELHGWVKRITWPELRSGLVLLAMTFIALPAIPDDPVGPFGGVNLREIWLIAIVLGGVSFLGYAAVKYFGATRGVLLAAAAGGLVSSTAVTVANARHVAAREGSVPLLSAGVAVATAVSFLRVVAIVTVLKPDLLLLIAPPLFAGAFAAGGFALLNVGWRDSKRGRQQAFRLRNPFEFWTVIGFAVLLGISIVFGRAAGEVFGAHGAIGSAVAMGIADVDAATISMVRLTPGPLNPLQVALAVLAAVASDTVSKIAIGAAIGRGRFAIEIAVMAALCFVAAGIVLLFGLGRIWGV